MRFYCNAFSVRNPYGKYYPVIRKYGHNVKVKDFTDENLLKIIKSQKHHTIFYKE